MRKVTICTDGGSRGNPGPSASGAVLKENGKVIGKTAKFLGTTTNNQAEYVAVIIGLEKAAALGYEEAEVVMDSLLAVKQLSGEYRVKNPGLAERFMEVHDLLHKFKRVSFRHVRREYNKEADALVNKCLDEEGC
jgi:ribonuclease HI